MRSQRYCSEDGFNYVIPHTIENNTQARERYIRSMQYIQQEYEKLQELGIANEDARYILPNACETILEVKMNGRELIHVMNERLCTRAQWEIRSLANKMKDLCVEKLPVVFKDCAFGEPRCIQNGGFCTEHMCCGKAPKLKDIIK